MVSVYPLDWEDVRATCERTSKRVADLIRSAPDPAARVAGLDWTVAELAAHLASLTERYDPFVRNTGRPDFETMPALNAQENAPFAGRSLEELARIIERGTASLLALCTSGDAPARFFDIESDCASAIALWVEELVVHGLDFARTAGKPWSISRSEALISLAGTLHVLPKFVDPVTTRGKRTVFEFRLRGGPTVAVAFDDGTATITEGRAAQADCRVSADPVAFLLVGLGRRSQWRAAATGKMLAFGRKPWLALQFAKFIVAA